MRRCLGPTSKRTRPKPKAVFRLPDLDQAKPAVLNSLTSAAPRAVTGTPLMNSWSGTARSRGYRFSRTVVLRCRIHLESRNLAPGTINLRLGAVRHLAYEAADCGLLSPGLAAGIRRVKGVKKIGVRLGNWLTAEPSHGPWQAPGGALARRLVLLPNRLSRKMETWPSVQAFMPDVEEEQVPSRADNILCGWDVA
jgi:hypothetical protein